MQRKIWRNKNGDMIVSKGMEKCWFAWKKENEKEIKFVRGKHIPQ